MQQCSGIVSVHASGHVPPRPFTTAPTKHHKDPTLQHASTVACLITLRSCPRQQGTLEACTPTTASTKKTHLAACQHRRLPDLLVVVVHEGKHVVSHELQEGDVAPVKVGEGL